MKRHIAIVQTHSCNNEELYQLTLPNHAQYAGTHSYDMLQFHVPWSKAKWEFIQDIRDVLKSYDHLLVVGSDILFTNMRKPLEHFVDKEYGMVMSLSDDGGSPINGDMILWNNNDKGLMTLDQIYSRREDLRNHPWIGQQAILEFLQTDLGKTCIKTLPCRQLQSAPIKRIEASAWQEGDFALHFVGGENYDKVERVRHFLNTGKVMWR